MQKIELIIIIILLSIFDVSAEHITNKTNTVIESNKRPTKNIYHFEVQGKKFETEDIHFLEKNSPFSLLNAT